MQVNSITYKVNVDYPALIKEARQKGQQENLEYWQRALDTAKNIIKDDKPKTKNSRNFKH